MQVQTTFENTKAMMTDDQRLVAAIASEARATPARIGNVSPAALLGVIEGSAKCWAACTLGVKVYRGGSHVAVMYAGKRVLLITVQ
jgi:hypothetical protein